MIDRSTVWRMTVARIRRNPLSSAALILLMAVSSATAGAAVGAIATAHGSTERLFALAGAPDVVQMHTGPIDRAAIDAFASSNPAVLDHQVQTALALPNVDLVLDGGTDLARTGVMDLLLVTQNDRFDHLLAPDGAPATVQDGEIGVPGYYADAYRLDLGDPILIVVDDIPHEFVVGVVVADAQMGPSLVNSKRFLLAPSDWNALAPSLETEQILTFRIPDGAGEAFASAYRDADLPADGAAVDGSLLRLIAALTDGIVAGLGMIVALTLIVIGLLCLRIMVLTALAEDARRIGLLRTLGFSHREVAGAALVGYAAHAAAGLVIALVGVLPLMAILTGSGAGTFAADESQATVAALGAVFVTSAIPMGIAAHLLRGLRGITPLASAAPGPDALSRRRRLRPFRHGSPVPVSLRLAIRSVTARGMSAILLALMLACASALAVMPLRLTQTIAAPGFVTVMGVGQSDLRLFIRSQQGDPDLLEHELDSDPEIERIAATASYRVDLRATEGRSDSIALDVGDLQRFPISYTAGRAPSRDGEIALSTLAAQSNGLSVGDSVDILVEGSAHLHQVIGVYHDITNGGRSGKVTAFAAGAGQPLWRTVLVDLAAGVDGSTKAAALSEDHPGVSITELDRFVQFTLGDTVQRLQAASVVAWASASALIMLVFALLGRLDVARNRSSLQLLRTLGWTTSDLRRITLLRTLAVTALGVLAGLVLVEAIGPSVLGAVLSAFGGGAMALASPDLLALTVAASIVVAAVIGSRLAVCTLPPIRDES